MFNPMPRILPGRRILDLLEGLDDEADRRVPDRMGRGLETGLVCRHQDRPELRRRVNEHPFLSGPSDVRSGEGGAVCAEGAVPEDLNRTESEPRVSESGAESALDERVQDGIPRHRVDPDAGSSGTL